MKKPTLKTDWSKTARNSTNKTLISCVKKNYYHSEKFSLMSKSIDNCYHHNKNSYIFVKKQCK